MWVLSILRSVLLGAAPHPQVPGEGDMNQARSQCDFQAGGYRGQPAEWALWLLASQTYLPIPYQKQQVLAQVPESLCSTRQVWKEFLGPGFSLDHPSFAFSVPPFSSSFHLFLSLCPPNKLLIIFLNKFKFRGKIHIFTEKLKPRWEQHPSEDLESCGANTRWGHSCLHKFSLVNYSAMWLNWQIASDRKPHLKQVRLRTQLSLWVSSQTLCGHWEIFPWTWK